jgi:hypothetical protein
VLVESEERDLIVAVQNDEPKPYSVTIGHIHFRAKCGEYGCTSVARLAFRYADRAGRPIRPVELCFRHSRDRVWKHRGEKLRIFDERGA